MTHAQRHLPTIALNLLLILSAAAGFAADPMILGEPPTPNAAETIRALEDQSRRAVLARDYATMERIWSEHFVVNTPGNYVLSSRAAVFDVFRRHTSDLYSSYEKSIECIAFNHDLAIVMGVETVTPQDGPGADKPAHRRFTNIWRLEDGAWLLIARQATMLAPGAPSGTPVLPKS